MIIKNVIIILMILCLLFGAGFIIYGQVHREINELEIAEFNKRLLAFKLTKVKIENYLDHLQDKLTIAVHKQGEKLNRLLDEPQENSALLAQIQSEINQELPGTLFSTLTDIHGKPIFADSQDFLLPACLENLQNFAQNQSFEIRIHATPRQSHFDMMFPLHAPGEQFSGIFFTAFTSIYLAELLKQGEDAYNQLFIVLDSTSGLIEIGSGMKNIVDGVTQLTPEQLARVSINEHINQSSWRLINLPSAQDPFLKEKNSIILKGLIALSVFYLLFAVLFYALIHSIKEKLDLSQRKVLYLDEKIDDILNNSTDAILTIDEQQKILFFNEEAERLFGYSRGEIIGQNLSKLIPEHAQSQHLAFVHQFRNSTKNQVNYKRRDKSLSISGLHKEGHILPLDIGISKTRTMAGNYVFTAFIRDLTYQNALMEEKEQAISALEHLANHDPLTKLPNRRQLKNDFHLESKRTQRFDRKMALYYMDLDEFKGVNDVYGHEVGDKLLRKISEKISRSLRENEKVYRVGGDEFCILISEYRDRQQLEKLAARIIKEISSIYQFDGMKIEIGCSIGIAIFPDNGETLQDLTTAADQAMYTIKTSDKNSYCFVK